MSTNSIWRSRNSSGSSVLRWPNAKGNSPRLRRVCGSSMPTSMRARREAFVAAAELVQNLLNTILSNKDVAIRLMNDKAGGEEMYYHALNVSVLAMMLAKELGVLPTDIEQLGLGCLFHDIGKTLIPYRVLKVDKPTRAEINLLQQHCAYGVTIGAKVSLSKEATEVVMQHHERFDGSGYPNGLKGEDISRLTRIASIVNVYDNHCNPPNPADALTPYEALAFMYAHERKWFDSNFLSVFIKSMGVYPPGTRWSGWRMSGWAW